MTNWDGTVPEGLPDGMQMIGGPEAMRILSELLPRPSIMFSYDERIVTALRHLHLPDAIVTRVPDNIEDVLENGQDENTPTHKLLMMNVGLASGTIGALVIHERDVVTLRDMLTAWLDHPEEAVLSQEEAAVWVNSSMMDLHNDENIRFRYGLFGTEWREWDEANDWVDHLFAHDDEAHNAWDMPTF